jgi:purine nucleoside phosphorylase
MTAAPAKFWHQAAGAVLARCRGPTAETRAENASQRKLDAMPTPT